MIAMSLCTKNTNGSDVSLHEWHERHDFRKRKTRCFLHGAFLHDSFCTNGTNGTISAKRKARCFLHDSSLHERHERYEFRKRKIRFFLHDSSLHERHERHDFRKRKARFLPARKTRFPQAGDTILLRVIKYCAVDLSTSCYSCLSCDEKIVQSTCRHRAIRAFRA